MNEFTVEWTDRAYLALRSIHSRIALQSEAGAKKVVRDLLLHSKTLAKMPRRCPIEPALLGAPVEYRFLLKWHYKIIFTVIEEEQKVLVVLVFDCSQNST